MGSGLVDSVGVRGASRAHEAIPISMTDRSVSGTARALFLLVMARPLDIKLQRGYPSLALF